MMRAPNSPSAIARAAVAALLAGPVFVGALALLAPVMSPRAITLDWQIPAAAIALLLPVILVGFAIAIVPALLGAGALLWAGGRNEGLRAPVSWAITGAAMAGGVGLFGGGHDGEFTAALAITGAISALICRTGARWI